MAYDGLSGKYGNIPDDVWLKKNEITDLSPMYGGGMGGMGVEGMTGMRGPYVPGIGGAFGVNPGYMNNSGGYEGGLPGFVDGEAEMRNHIRNLLVDQRPDRPFLESDQPRGSNIPGSGFMSEQMINLRTAGALTTTSPHLPDGTFLDHEFTERDPRGTATGPDMRKYVDQERARGSFFRYSPDADWSVPEQGINPVQMVANINSGFYPAKDRMQWFDESIDAWHNGGTVQRARTGGNDKGKTTFDGTIVDLTEASYANRQDAMTKLSNDPLMAYRHSVPDQRVKIARYGNTRISQSLKTQDWRANRASAYINHDIGKIAENERVNTELATAIINLQRIHDTRQAVFDGLDYGDSATRKNIAAMVPKEVLNEIFHEGLQSQPDSAQMQVGDKYMRRDAKRREEIRQEMGKSDYNHVVLEAMTSVNKKERKLTDMDLLAMRERVDQSSSDQGIYLQGENRARTEKSDRLKSLLNQEDTRAIEGSRAMANYKMAPIRETIEGQRTKMSRVGMESYKSDSDGTLHKKGRGVTRDLVQNIKKYGETPLYEEFGHTQGRTTGQTKNKERVRDNYEADFETHTHVDLLGAGFST